VRVEVLIFKGCPHANAAIELVREVVANLAPGASVDLLNVDTPERAGELGFLGSPSVRINGKDIERRRTSQGALCCRTYFGNGAPPRWMIEAGILRALKPKGILFLCVANSARSQMAEGIARSVALPGVKIWSAGSRPATIRPEAVAVLKEIGIDISAQHSKAVAEIPTYEVDTVITLCAEEECPVFLGKARRLHWALTDPATASRQENLSAFRKTRDELLQRITAFLKESCG
jgi:arsenate reductase